MQPTPFLLEQLGDVGMHQQEIETLFEGRVAWDGPPGAIGHPLIVIAFTNRCGSNYLAELMRSTGQIAGLGEALNADAIATRCDRWEIDSFPAYFRTLAERHKKPFGMKASWDQLLMLLRWRIHEMHAGLRVVHIYRRDVIGQAISRDIAWQTRKWTSLTEVEHAVTPNYDATRIGQQITAIQREEGLFPLIFDAYDLPVVHVAYEDLVARPAAVVRSTMQAIGYPCPDWQRKPTRIKKHADATNDAFRARYRELLQRRCIGADRTG